MHFALFDVPVARFLFFDAFLTPGAPFWVSVSGSWAEFEAAEGPGGARMDFGEILGAIWDPLELLLEMLETLGASFEAP